MLVISIINVGEISPLQHMSQTKAKSTLQDMIMKNSSLFVVLAVFIRSR